MNIQSLVDNYLRKKDDKKKSRKRSGKFNGSALGRCYQYQVWDRENVPKADFDSRTLRVFQAGNLFHQFVQDIIKIEHPEMEIEVTYQDDDIICRADILTKNEAISLKSMHSNGFWHMKRSLENGSSIKESKYTHYLQVSSECVFNSKKGARLVYISKDDLCIEEFGFINNDIMKNDVSNELSNLRISWESKKPHAKPRTYGHDKRNGKPNECFKFCGYKEKCEEVHGSLDERLKRGDL